MKKKEIYILKGIHGESYKDFRARMFALVDVLKGLNGLIALKITLTEGSPPILNVIPFKKDKVAVISIVSNEGIDNNVIVNNAGFKGGYRVSEAVPVKYEPIWDPGNVTPGVCLLTLFQSRPDISYETFIDRWHNSHTPLSLKIHPLWNYIRNVVTEHAAENSHGYQGIVEEQLRTRRELLNPFVFFGPLHRVPRHMIQVYRDTKSFIDYKGIETYLANEYLVTR